MIFYKPECAFQCFLYHRLDFISCILIFTEVHSRPSETPKMGLFAKIVNGFKYRCSLFLQNIPRLIFSLDLNTFYFLTCYNVGNESNVSKSMSK